MFSALPTEVPPNFNTFIIKKLNPDETAKPSHPDNSVFLIFI